MGRRSDVDWESVEKEYRAGVKSLRQIGEECGCSHVAIQKRASSEGWVRDLSAKIRAAAEAKVTKDAVTNLVTVETKIAERELVEANAELQASIVRAHRKDISRSRRLALALLEELEQQTDNRDLYEQLGVMLANPDDKGIDKLNDLYRKVIALPSRVESIKKLADTLKTLVGLERQAFGLAENPDDGGKEEATVTLHLQGCDGARIQVNAGNKITAIKES